MKLRTVIVIAGLGALAARKAAQSRHRRPPLLLEPGPPLAPPPSPPAPSAPVPEAQAPPTVAAQEPPVAGPENRSAQAPSPPPAHVQPAAHVRPADEPQSAESALPDAAEEESPEAQPPASEPAAVVPEAPPASPAATMPEPEVEPAGGRAGEDTPPPGAGAERAPSGWSVVLYPDEERAAEPGPGSAPAGEEAEPAGDADRSPPAPPEAPAEAKMEAEVTVVLETPVSARRFLLENQAPLVFMGATPFAMLGVDRLVGRWSAVTVHDCFDGRHGGVYVPRGGAPRALGSLAAAGNALLQLPDVVDRLRLRPGRIVVLAGDEETERLAGAFGYAVALAPAAIRRRLSAVSELGHLAGDAGLLTVPAVTGHAASYQELLLLARGLGTDLVVESLDRPGRPAVAIGSLEDWSAHERQLAAEQLRVTRRLEGRSFTVPGVATARGVLASPTIAELRRFPDLPTYGGGGLAVSDAAASLPVELRSSLRTAALAVGDRLARDGFVGMFEADLAVDRRLEGITLTAIRPEASLALALDTVSAIADDELPLLALHVAALLGADLEADVDALASRWNAGGRSDPWSFFVLVDTAEAVETVTEAPASGVWRLDPSAHGGMRYVRSETDWRTVTDGDEAFYLRIQRAGSVRYPGAEVGIVVARGAMATADGQPTERALQWVRGVRKNVWTAAAPAGEAAPGRAPGTVVV